MKYKISSITLAAGMSKRMNLGNKLLLKLNNTPIIVKTINNILLANFYSNFVILGYQYKLICNLIENYNIKIFYNKNFKEGMSTSIIEGVKQSEKFSDGIMICLGDMPSISYKIYNKILKVFDSHYNEDKPLILVPNYKGSNGNPVLFSRHFFSKLKKVCGDKGGKELINKYKNYIMPVNINDHSIITDVDNEESYNKLNNNDKKSN